MLPRPSITPQKTKSKEENDSNLYDIIPANLLAQPTDFVHDVRYAQQNLIEPSEINAYSKFIQDQHVNFANFMALTTPPQNSPYGITGNPNAMRDLELQQERRPPTKNNPFMNVPITDYNVPQKYSKAEQTCGKACKANFYDKLFRSIDDGLFERSASERQFYTMPNSSVPDERDKFAQWLYGKNLVGKSGSIYSRYGYPYTPDSLVNTGVNAATPENGGQINNNYGLPIAMEPNASPWTNNLNYGYGFGGVPGGIPFHNLTPEGGQSQLDPMPLFPTFPHAVPRESQGTVPPHLNQSMAESMSMS